jgi:CHASE3 domain sensor protein
VKLFTALLSLLAGIVSLWREHKAKQEARETIQEQLDANVEKAEAAVATPDPERDERLRRRFDRAHRG